MFIVIWIQMQYKSTVKIYQSTFSLALFPQCYNCPFQLYWDLQVYNFFVSWKFLELSTKITLNILSGFICCIPKRSSSWLYVNFFLFIHLRFINFISQLSVLPFCVYVHLMHAWCPQRAGEVFRSPVTRDKGDSEPTVWMISVESLSSERTISTLNCRATTPFVSFLKLFLCPLLILDHS